MESHEPGTTLGRLTLALRPRRLGPWYGDGEESHRSCRNLRWCVTEFGAQGLELVGVLLAWGTDLVWEEGTEGAGAEGAPGACWAAGSRVCRRSPISTSCATSCAAGRRETGKAPDWSSCPKKVAGDRYAIPDRGERRPARQSCLASTFGRSTNI